MKIGIDISQIVYKGTGVARFTDGLVNSILDNDEKNDWVFLFSSLRRKLDKKIEEKINRKKFKLIKIKLPPIVLSFLWNKLHCYPLEKIVGNLDWFISSDWTEPPTNKIKKATIVHDLVFMRYPETVTKKIFRNQEQRLNWVKKESQIIFVDSLQTKKDLNTFLKINDARVILNYPGVSIKKPSQQVIKNTIIKHHLSKPFILSVGKIEPRKNFPRLVEAFKKIDQPDLKLLIVGPEGWEKLNVKNKNIQIINQINDEELFSFYNRCLFFICPSIWEGFGYPVVEAMKSGAPVIASNVSSLKEVAGEAALLINPLSVENISQTMLKMINDKQLRKNLSDKGLIRAEKFSWKTYYNKLISNLKFKI